MSSRTSQSSGYLRIDHFPREILEVLADWLDGPSIFSLYACGDLSFCQKLSDSVRSFRLDYKNGIVSVWPRILSAFPLLKEVSLTGPDADELIAGVDYRMLPPTITRLCIGIEQQTADIVVLRRFHFSDPDALSHLFEPETPILWPNLQHLDLQTALTDDCAALYLDAIKELPLASLAWCAMDVRLLSQVPPTLLHLRLRRLLVRPGLEPVFPTNLESLHIQASVAYSASELFKVLPTSMKSLVLPFISIRASDFRALPQKLEAFSCYNPNEIRDPSDATFPPTLTYLAIPITMLAFEALGRLPPKLTTLLIKELEHGAHPVFPPNLTEMGKLSAIAYPNPPSVLPTRLKRFIQASSLALPPKPSQFSVDVNDPLYISALPRQLEELNINSPTWLISPETLERDLQLPPAITRISLGAFTEVTPDLSNMLLRVIGSQLKTLTSLNLSIGLDMRSLHHLQHPLQQLFVKCPPVLVQLQLPVLGERMGFTSPPLDSKQYRFAHQWWRDLRSLDIMSTERVTAQWVATLPETLETLIIAQLSTAHASGKILRVLPPRLKSLNIQVQEIGPGDLCSLPRKLSTIFVRCPQDKATFPISDFFKLPYSIISISAPKWNDACANSEFLAELRKTHMFH